MLITCSSCNSKYLLNSADLKPNGRKVRCSICNEEWFQEPNYMEDLNDESQTLNLENKEIKKNEAALVSNLPSTYVKEQKPSGKATKPNTPTAIK